jgi:adenine-specific DNA glycosylase
MVLYTLVSGLSAGLVDRNVARMLSRMNKFKNTCWGKKKDIKKKPYDSWSGSTN